MYEIPWGRSQLVFLYDSEIINDPFYDIESFKKFLISNKGRFTYPKIPNFHGTTFLKQIMYELGHQDIMKEEYDDLNQSHKNAIQDLISFLNEYHPYMWSEGKRFPKNNTTMMQMLANRELFISLSFNPNEASSQITQNNLRKSTKTFTFQNGSIANTHFLAIPKYSKNIDQSLLIIDKLISPKYQSLKLKNDIWGDPTVLDFTKLSMEDKSLFLYKNFENNLKTDVPKKTEPHNSWTEVIEKNWIEIFN
jgi:putative thiamine transport system substrate-binding protein